MMRSLYSGVSGMRTHQIKMDVIGNNIANVNTLAYKSSSITFGELMYQTTQRASGPNALTGTAGINARQIGLGVQAGAINTNIAQAGASQTTGNPFDLKITGDSFFVVGDGTKNYFTRAGAFYVDGGGNLAMTSNGYNVMGWAPDANGDIKKDNVTALRIMNETNMTYPPEATTKGYVSGIIDLNDTDVNGQSGKIMNLKFYDNLGYSYTAKLSVKATSDTPTTGQYAVELVDILDSTNKSVKAQYPNISLGGNQVISGDKKLSLATGIDLTNFKYTKADGTETTVDITGAGAIDPADADGKLRLDALAKAYGCKNGEEFLNYQVTAVTSVGPPPVSETKKVSEWLTTPGLGAIASATDSSIETDGRHFQGGIIKFDIDTGKFAGINGQPATTDMELNMGGYGKFSNIDINFEDASMYDNAGTSTVAAVNGDSEGKGSGRKLGELSSISIQQNGMIYASYDNNMSRLLGQIAVAEFANPSGLEKVGDNLYEATMNSGQFDGIGTDVSANGGAMNTGTLEMSNVDLSQEFAEMITTQRGFQANSRIITVSDSLLEELVNLKR